uniref:Uncharacterized protein n=1 Tax=Setaria italica TaxID=4555 RepID=K3YLB1_SETIT
MKGVGRRLSGTFRKVTGSSSSHSHISTSTHHSIDYTPSSMQEEDMPQEEQSGPQAMEVEGPPLDLHGDWEIQAYALIKDRVFAHTQAFDTKLLENTVVVGKFAPRCNDMHNPTLRLMHISVLYLYKCRELTLPLAPQEETSRSNVSGRPPQSQHIMQQMYQAGWLPDGQMPGFTPRYQPGWDQPPQPHEAGGSG